MEVWAPGIVQINQLDILISAKQYPQTIIGVRLLSKLKTQNQKKYLITLFIKITKQYLTLQQSSMQGSQETILYQQQKDLTRFSTNKVGP